MRSLMILVVLVAATEASAASSASECREIAAPLSEAAQTMRSLLGLVEATPIAAAANRFEDPEKEHLLAVERAKNALIEPFEEYVVALEEAEFAIRRCSR